MFNVPTMEHFQICYNWWNHINEVEDEKNNWNERQKGKLISFEAIPYLPEMKNFRVNLKN